MAHHFNLILNEYQSKFQNKVQPNTNSSTDILMDCFNLSDIKKQENKQYWNRELGACWQKIVCAAFKDHKGYQSSPKTGKAPYDLIVDQYAIDTKYRIGSGDSGTIRKIRLYGDMMKELNHEPILLILRTDNLKGTINALKNWTILTGEESFEFIQRLSGVDVEKYLKDNKGAFSL
jgi:hypothetical protein